VTTPSAPQGVASAGQRFRDAVARERPLQVPGAINAYHAILAEKSGFAALYLSGGGVAAGSLGPISDSGARSRVHATGVGAPRSFITVTMASPMPRPVITAPRSS